MRLRAKPAEQDNAQPLIRAMANTLLDRGVDVNSPDIVKGVTALMSAGFPSKLIGQHYVDAATMAMIRLRNEMVKARRRVRS